MAKKKVYINPGHSDKDVGAVGYETERELTVAVSKHMRDYLTKNYECEIKMTPGSTASLTAICNEANRWGADLFVSNHFNAGKGDGYEALVYSEKTKALGQIFERYVKAAGQNSRGVKYRPDLGVLRLTKMKAILNEGAFVDNWTDIKEWNDDAELKLLGTAYAKAAADWLDLPVKNVSAGGGAGSGSGGADSGTPFLVRVTVKDLYIRKGPGTDYGHKGFIKPGVYTIVEQTGRWGRLKSGAGWICLDYAKRL